MKSPTIILPSGSRHTLEELQGAKVNIKAFELLLFAGENQHELSAIELVSPSRMSGTCRTCGASMFQSVCSCKDAKLVFCTACVPIPAVTKALELLGHRSCTPYPAPPPPKPKPTPKPWPKLGDPPPSGMRIGTAPDRPYDFVQCAQESLVELCDVDPRSMTRDAFMEKHGLAMSDMQSLCQTGAVSVQFVRHGPAWNYSRYAWSFENYFLVANRRVVLAKSERRASIAAKAARKYPSQKTAGQKKKDRARYRAEIEGRSGDFLYDGSECGFVGDGGRRVRLPSLADYDTRRGKPLFPDEDWLQKETDSVELSFVGNTGVEGSFGTGRNRWHHLRNSRRRKA